MKRTKFDFGTIRDSKNAVWPVTQEEKLIYEENLRHSAAEAGKRLIAQEPISQHNIARSRSFVSVVEEAKSEGKSFFR